MDDLASRLATIVESSDDAIIGKTLEGVITSWNPGAERLFGYPAAEAIGRPISMLVPADRPNEEPEILARIRAGQRVPSFETVRRRKDGSLVDVSVTISPVFTPGGQLVGASKIARDISERRRASRKLHAQLAQLHLLDQITRAIGEHHDLASIYQVAVRSIEEHLPLDFAAIARVEPDRAGVQVSHVGVRSADFSMRVALGEGPVPAEETSPLGRSIRGAQVYEPDTLAAPEGSFARRLSQAGLRSMAITPLEDRGVVFGLVIAGRREPGRFDSGDCEFLRQLAAHLSLATRQADLLASLRQVNEDLRRAQAAALQQERMRAVGQMASGVAHDIRNALMPALLYAEELLDSERSLSAAGREQLQVVARAVGDVASIVERLREFYRPRGVSQAMARVSLNEIVPQVVDISRARWHDMARHQRISIEVQAELGAEVPPVMGSASEIRESLLNLVLNAIDAMPEGGTLQLATGCCSGSEAPGGAWVAVSDDGIGMDVQTQRLCLDPFFTTKGDRGTGMGLAMVYAMAQRHGADLGLQSEPGEGTTFTLRFPPPSAEVASARDAPPAAVQRTGEKMRLKVLVIDDDPLVLDTLKTMLGAAGQDVTSAQGGRAGIDAFVAALEGPSPFEAVFTDLGMPGVDGREVARAIRERSARVPLVLLTGWGEGVHGGAADPGLFDRVMSKPPRLRDLREALAEFAALG